jgi:hypothetical protein
MPKQDLYEYAVTYYDSDKKDNVVVVEPTTVLANDPEHARLKAARAIPADYDDKLDKLDIKVKLFR